MLSQEIEFTDAQKIFIKSFIVQKLSQNEERKISLPFCNRKSTNRQIGLHKIFCQNNMTDEIVLSIMS